MKPALMEKIPILLLAHKSDRGPGRGDLRAGYGSGMERVLDWRTLFVLLMNPTLVLKEGQPPKT
jgi:hypothetical protein